MTSIPGPFTATMAETTALSLPSPMAPQRRVYTPGSSQAASFHRGPGSAILRAIGQCRCRLQTQATDEICKGARCCTAARKRSPDVAPGRASRSIACQGLLRRDARAPPGGAATVTRPPFGPIPREPHGKAGKKWRDPDVFWTVKGQRRAAVARACEYAHILCPIRKRSTLGRKCCRACARTIRRSALKCVTASGRECGTIGAGVPVRARIYAGVLRRAHRPSR